MNLKIKFCGLLVKKAKMEMDGHRKSRGMSGSLELEKGVKKPLEKSSTTSPAEESLLKEKNKNVNGNGSSGNGVGNGSSHSDVDSGYSLIEMVVLMTIFMLSGPLLIMSNKFILKDLELGYPLTLTMLTLVFCSVACWSYVLLLGIKLKNEDVITMSFFVRRIMPIGFLAAATIVLGMASYLYLTVAFVQMLKAFTPVMTLGFMVSFGLSHPSSQVVGTVIVICIGTGIAGFGEVNFNLLGMMCMLSAQVCEALKLIFTQVVLQNLKFDLVESLCYITPASAAFVFVFAVFIEFPQMTRQDFEVVEANFMAFVLSCIFSLSTNVINTLVIKFSNALTLKLLATARNALLVLFNAIFLGEIVTMVQFFGYSLSLIGFCAYNYVNYWEKNSK